MRSAVLVSRELAQTVLTLMERAAVGDHVPAGQWRTFAGDLAAELDDAGQQRAFAAALAAELAPTCHGCGEKPATTTSPELCDECRATFDADVALMQAEREARDASDGCACSPACGGCGRCCDGRCGGA